MSNVRDIRDARGDYAVADVLESLAADIRSGDVESPSSLMLSMRCGDRTVIAIHGDPLEVVALAEVGKGYATQQEIIEE